MKQLIISLLVLLFSINLSGQCTLACNSLLQVALDSNNPQMEITSDMVLEGNPAMCPNLSALVNIQETGTNIDIPTSPHVGLSEVGKDLVVFVTDQVTGTACWGNLSVEIFSFPGKDVTYCDGRAVNNFKVNITTDNPNIGLNIAGCNLETNNVKDYINCVAAQNDLPSSNHYILEINAENDNDSYLNGVSTLDQVLIQQHILNLRPFETCIKAAADLNSDNRISVLDLVQGRKLILGIIDKLPNSPSWKYYNYKALSSFPVIVNEDTDLKFTQAEFPLTDFEIIAIKVGDVNGSAVLE